MKNIRIKNILVMAMVVLLCGTATSGKLTDKAKHNWKVYGGSTAGAVGLGGGIGLGVAIMKKRASAASLVRKNDMLEQWKKDDPIAYEESAIKGGKEEATDWDEGELNEAIQKSARKRDDENQYNFDSDEVLMEDLHKESDESSFKFESESGSGTGAPETAPEPEVAPAPKPAPETAPEVAPKKPDLAQQEKAEVNSDQDMVKSANTENAAAATKDTNNVSTGKNTASGKGADAGDSAAHDAHGDGEFEDIAGDTEDVL